MAERKRRWKLCVDCGAACSPLAERCQHCDDAERIATDRHFKPKRKHHLGQARIVRKRPPVSPSERQLRAFEHYFASGENRSYKATAAVAEVSTVSVSNWARKYEWEKEVKRRSDEMAHAMALETNRIFRTTRQKYLAIMEKIIDEAITVDARGQIISTRIKLRNMQDLERAIKLRCSIMGIRFPDEEEDKLTLDEELQGMPKDFVEEVVEELKIILSRKYTRQASGQEKTLSSEEIEQINRGEL